MTRVALITGAARGLGAATALRLAADGWRLVLTDVCRDDPATPYALATAEDLDRSLALTRTAAGRSEDVVALVADVRSQADLDAAVAEAVTRFGCLDAAVAVAGVLAGGGPAWETDDASWQQLFEVNVGGVRRLARAAVPTLLSGSSGRNRRFVAVSSAAGIRPLPRLAAYAASKHAVVGLVRSLAADLAGTDVTANVVAPGSMDTAMLGASAAVYGLDSTAAFAAHHHLRRLVEPAEVAETIAWLCSPASSALTGTVVSVDGGFTG